VVSVEELSAEEVGLEIVDATDETIVKRAEKFISVPAEILMT
jgi:hypothetical protein